MSTTIFPSLHSVRDNALQWFDRTLVITGKAKNHKTKTKEGLNLIIIIREALKEYGQSWDFVPTRGGGGESDRIPSFYDFFQIHYKRP